MAWGEFPPEYNAKVHGIYDPGRYYGKPDTAFGQVKLGELGSWIGRRKKTPLAVGQLFGRAYWRFNHKMIYPWKASSAGVFQMVAGAMFFFYVINYPKLKRHRLFKYHW